jgi:hypothetical protein
MGKHDKDVIVELPQSGPPGPVSLASGDRNSLQLQPQRHWIEIELIDEFGDPAAGETFRLEAKDGTVMLETTLDDNGRARVHGFTADECVVTFPNLESQSWVYSGSSEEVD